MFPLLKSIQTLKKASLFGFIVISAVIAVFVVFAAAAGITWLSAELISFETKWIDNLVTGIIGIASGIGGWFMLPALIVLISGMFQEKVIHRVESVYYPRKMRSEQPKFWPDFLHDVKFTLWALLLNILVLPFYFFAAGFFISIALNSYLLGREFFESAAGYHIGKAGAKELGARYKGTVYGGGFAITLMTLVPFLNILVPILAVVWMVHVYHFIQNK